MKPEEYMKLVSKRPPFQTVSLPEWTILSPWVFKTQSGKRLHLLKLSETKFIPDNREEFISDNDAAIASLTYGEWLLLESIVDLELPRAVCKFIPYCTRN